MQTVSRVVKAMQEVLVKRANELALSSGFTERERVLTGSSFVSGLVSGWQANPNASLENLSQAIGNAGTPISRQGLVYRFDAKACVFLKAVLASSLEQMVSAVSVSKGLLGRFASVEIADSSVISLPNELGHIWRGSGGNGANARVSSLKLNVRVDVRSGRLKVLELSDGVQQDRESQAHQQVVQAGGLYLADLGYFKLDDFERIARGESYFLSRYKLKTHLYDQQGERIKLHERLPQQLGQSVSWAIQLGKQKRLACRLVAERVPQQVIKQRHERIRETARQKQQPVSQEALDMASWTIYVTNVPEHLLTPREVFILGRYRWQIELLFKLWKSHLGVDQWRTHQPERILCEIYGKLIAAIVTHWLLLVACWHNPRRSFIAAMPTIRGLAWQFANSLIRRSLLGHAFDALIRALSKSNMGSARADPRAWQLLYEDIS